MKNHSSQDTTLDISIIGLMSALVFVGTYFFKIPSAFGYTHLGDCMIILTVCLFGTRRGVLAGAIGAGLSDFLGGYAVWVLPTMVLKGLWAFIAGTIAYGAFCLAPLLMGLAESWKWKRLEGNDPGETTDRNGTRKEGNAFGQAAL